MPRLSIYISEGLEDLLADVNRAIAKEEQDKPSAPYVTSSVNVSAICQKALREFCQGYLGRSTS